MAIRLSKAPEEEKNFTMFFEMINASAVREDDPEFQSPLNLVSAFLLPLLFDESHN